MFHPTGQVATIPVSDAAKAAAAGSGGPYFEDARVSGVHIRVLTRPSQRAGFALQAARPLTEVDQALHRLWVFLLLVSAGGIGLAALLGAMIARTTIGPVRRLTEAAEHVTSTSDLSERVTVESEDELGRLGASFNHMLEALEASVHAAATAGGRRLPRAADPTHQPSDQRRGPGPKRRHPPAASASASTRTWSPRSRS